MHAARRKHQKVLICSAIRSYRVLSDLAQFTHGNPRRPNNAKVGTKKDSFNGSAMRSLGLAASNA
jgi:hypothetical protein